MSVFAVNAVKMFLESRRFPSSFHEKISRWVVKASPELFQLGF